MERWQVRRTERAEMFGHGTAGVWKTMTGTWQGQMNRIDCYDAAARKAWDAYALTPKQLNGLPRMITHDADGDEYVL